MRVFLTGGTGLIGSHVADRLRRRGDEVVALVRSTSDTRHLAGLGCRLVTGDVLDAPEIQVDRMRGCDAVIHGAARVFLGGSRTTFLRENVEGTERVLTAAARVAPRVVHLSSVAVYAGLPMDRPLTETRWTEADPDRQSPYAASKHLSERAAWRLHGEGAITLTTVRPSVVYGPRDRAAAPIMLRFATAPLIPLPGGGRSALPVVYVGNVARGIIAALDRDATAGRAYNLALDHPLTAREAVETIARELGRRARIITVPAAAVKAVGAVAGALSPWLPAMRAGGIQRAARSLVTDNPYDSSRARLELGWTNLVSHAEGLKRTVEWWRSRDAAEDEGDA